nr:hypothetical protein [Pandoravirus aubagnensis]
MFYFYLPTKSHKDKRASPPATPTDLLMNTARPFGKMRPLMIVVVAAVMTLLTGTSLVSAAYQPTGSPTISVGEMFAIYSVHYGSFCAWQGYDPQSTYDWESVKCNVAKPLLSQASRFIADAPYPRQVCGRIPTTHNVSVSLSVVSVACAVPDVIQKCAVNNPRGGSDLINCGPYDDPADASLLFANVVAPPDGVDGWLHGGETPVTVTSAGASAACAVDTGLGRILCPGPVPAVGPNASLFYLVPAGPQPNC